MPPPRTEMTLGTTTDAERITVGVADLQASRDASRTLVTYALGSCIGVTVWDPILRAGGMLHFMLPEGALNATKSVENPFMFGDTGFSLLLERVLAFGARRDRLVICAAGGAEILADEGHFRIGSRNRTLLRKILWKHGMLLSADDTGGSHSRTLSLRLCDGATLVRSQGKERSLWPS